MARIGLSQQKWTHVQLCDGRRGLSEEHVRMRTRLYKTVAANKRLLFVELGLCDFFGICIALNPLKSKLT